jgi:hypothetical protein
MENVEQQIKSELELYDERQTALQQLEQELQADPKFAQFLEARKSFAELEAQVWSKVEQVMLDNNIKTIKTDKVTLTMAERTNFEIDLDLLPAKYIKKVPNTTLIGSEFKLTGKPVKGTTPSKKLYLTKRFKKEA